MWFSCFLANVRFTLYLSEENEREKKNTSDLCDRKITAKHLVIFHLSKARQQLLSNVPLLWHLLCSEVEAIY